MKFNILITDDEIEFRDILVSIVEMIFLKYYPAIELKISVASNGQEELSIAQSEAQDIIITDINMPVMDGKEAVRKIRLFDKSVPILALTALTDIKDVEEIIQSGVSNYTAKPLNKKLFIAQIRSFVNLFIKSHFSYNKKAINLISKQVFKRKTIFNIEWVEDLEEFWEFLIEQSLIFKHMSIQEILQTMYNLEFLMIKNNIPNELILEENEENYYITISKIDELDDDILVDFLDANNIDTKLMKKDDNFVTFLVSKNEQDELEEQKQVEVIKDPIEELKHELDEAKELDLRYTIHEKVTADELSEELDPSIEDKLENFEDDIDSLRLSLYDFEEVSKEEARESLNVIIELLKNFNKVVENIGLFNVIFRSFNSFVFFLKNLDNEIIEDMEKRRLLSSLVRGLVDDLEQWIVNVFIEHTAYDIHYLDASFAENCLEIEKIFLEHQDDLDEDDEDDDSLEFF